MRTIATIMTGVGVLLSNASASAQPPPAAEASKTTIQDALRREALAERRARDVIRLDLRKLVDERKAREQAAARDDQAASADTVITQVGAPPIAPYYTPFNPYAARSLDAAYQQWAAQFDYHLGKGYGIGYPDMGFRYAKEHAFNLDRYFSGGLAGSRFGGYAYSGETGGAATHTETYEGRRERLNLEDSNRRAERLIARHRIAYEEGAALLRAGQTRAAVTRLSMATQLNHADPAARIVLSQARLALGDYEAAGAALRRAFELQPNAIYEELPLEEYHADGGLGARIDELAAWMARESASRDVYLLRAYLEWRRGKLDVARAALERLLQADPDDEPAKALLGLVGG